MSNKGAGFDAAEYVGEDTEILVTGVFLDALKHERHPLLRPNKVSKVVCSLAYLQEKLMDAMGASGIKVEHIMFVT